MDRKSQKIHNRTKLKDLPDLVFKVKAKNKRETKFPSPCRCNRVIRAIHRRQDAEHPEPIDVSQSFLPYEELDLCNDFISNELDYIDRFYINFPSHYVLKHVLSDSDPLDNVGSWKEVVQPTKQQRSVGPHRLKPKKTTSKKKTHQKNKKSRSVTT